MNILVKLIMTLFTTLAIYSSYSYKPNASEITVSDISADEITFEETSSSYYYDSYYYVYDGKVFNNTKNEYFISSLSVKATLTYGDNETSELNEILDIDYLPFNNYADFDLRFQLAEPVEATNFVVTIIPIKFVAYRDYTLIKLDGQNLELTKTKRLSVSKSKEENKVTTTLRTYIDNNYESKYLFYYGYVTFKDQKQYFLSDYPSCYDLYIDLAFTFEDELTDDDIKAIEESVKQNFVAIEFVNESKTTTTSYSNGLDSLTAFLLFFFIAQFIIALIVVLIIVLVNKKKKGK